MRCRLKAILKEEGRSQTWLGKKANISKTSLSEIVNEKRVPTLAVAFRIARVLNRSIEDIWIEE